jgi:hypothetical protein
MVQAIWVARRRHGHGGARAGLTADDLHVRAELQALQKAEVEPRPRVRRCAGQGREPGRVGGRGRLVGGALLGRRRCAACDLLFRQRDVPDIVVLVLVLLHPRIRVRAAMQRR